MFEIVKAILAFILALSILVTFHEFGHYWVAKRLGVRILRFSIGFGKPLMHFRFSRPRRRRGFPVIKAQLGEGSPSAQADDGSTEFVIAALPIGGYVKMLDEREGEVPEAQRDRAFNRQSLAARAAIVAAGPIANFMFAVLAYWLTFVLGVVGTKPIIGSVDAGSIAELAGLRPGDEFIAIAGRDTPTWEAVLQASLTAIVNDRVATVEIARTDAPRAKLELDFSAVDVDDAIEGLFFDVIGVRPQLPILLPIVAAVTPGSPAERAGFKAGDRVLEADGRVVVDWQQWVEYVRAHPAEPISVLVMQETGQQRLTVIPERVRDGAIEIGRIGATVDQSAVKSSPELGIERYGPLDALIKALQRTYEITVMTVKVMYQMVFGETSVSNLGGPISIANYASQSAHLGIVAFISFLAVISVSLAVINLLPVPLLDGGHLLFYLIEFVRGRPVPDAVQAYGQQVGLVFLLGLMGLAVYNDIMRFI